MSTDTKHTALDAPAPPRCPATKPVTVAACQMPEGHGGLHWSGSVSWSTPAPVRCPAVSHEGTRCTQAAGHAAYHEAGPVLWWDTPAPGNAPNNGLEVDPVIVQLQAELADAIAQLAIARAELADTQRALRDTRAELERVTKERDEAAAERDTLFKAIGATEQETPGDIREAGLEGQLELVKELHHHAVARADTDADLFQARQMLANTRESLDKIEAALNEAGAPMLNVGGWPLGVTLDQRVTLLASTLATRAREAEGVIAATIRACGFEEPDPMGHCVPEHLADYVARLRAHHTKRIEWMKGQMQEARTERDALRAAVEEAKRYVGEPCRVDGCTDSRCTLAHRLTAALSPAQGDVPVDRAECGCEIKWGSTLRCQGHTEEGGEA